MDRLTRRIALAELKELKAAEKEYAAEVEEWYRSGDGRRPHYWTNPETGRTRNYGGKGYSFPYCEHGSSRWTDYDNICGGCEGDYGTLYERAIWAAKEKVENYRARCDWVLSAPKHLDPDVKSDLVKWAVSALD